MKNPAVKGILCPRCHRWQWRWPFRQVYAGPAFALRFDPPNPFTAGTIIRNTETGESMVVDPMQASEGTDYTQISRRGIGSIGTLPINFCDEFIAIGHWSDIAEDSPVQVRDMRPRLRAV